jgi:SulP family sulfate permease
LSAAPSRGIRLAPGLHPFRPRALDLLAGGYDRQTFMADLVAGVTVGIIALPLAMAFAIASGVKPEAGIYAAIIGGFIVSLLGGTRVQIGGPAGAFIVIVYGIVQQYGLGNLIASTVMAGVLLFVMGLLRVGSLIRLVPVPIIIGFTNGIAVLIMLSQVKDFLGLKIAAMPADFFGQARTLAAALDSLSLAAVAMSLASLLLLAAWPRIGSFVGRSRVTGAGLARTNFVSRLPAAIVVLVLATLSTALFQLPLETIGTRFGGIPDKLPSLVMPGLSWDTARNLVGPTLTIALLGAVESLLCARIADGMIDDRHDPNQELMAQGVANVITPFFGGLPVTGTIARTTANVRTGGRTPVAGMLHAVTLLAILLVAAPLAVHVPLAALAAILVFVAWNMGEWREFRRLAQLTVPYSAVMVTTFVLTVVVDLTAAVQIGLVLASLLFIYRISSLTTIAKLDDELLPAGVSGFRIYGALFFGSVGRLEALIDYSESVQPKVLILDLNKLIHTDTTGIDALDAIRRMLERRGSRMVVCDLNAQPRLLMMRSGFLEKVGSENVLADLPAAIARARGIAEP